MSRTSVVPVAALGAALVAAWGRPADAGSNDLNLLNLCRQGTPARGVLGGMVPECAWVRRAGNGIIDGIVFDGEAESRFRSLMSELGVAMAPRLSVPAETLGYAGFSLSGELGGTTISQGKDFWNGVQGVSPLNPSLRRPDGWLTTVGLFARKGLWLPLPAVELGAGFMHLADSRLMSWQGYAKVALHEGFYDFPLPSVAARAGVALVTGSDQARMTVTSLDLMLSKGWGLLKTSRIEPFGGWSFLFIHARASPVDATPSCDAFVVRTARPGDMLGDYCAEAQRGTGNDNLANFAFPDQDVITRHRFFGGAKLKFATVFVVAQYEIIPAGRSRDERKPNGARDGSSKQEGLSLSAGFDY